MLRVETLFIQNHIKAFALLYGTMHSLELSLLPLFPVVLRKPAGIKVKKS